MKLTEFIGITSRNMHVKFGAVWRSFNFWQKNADSAPTLEKGWNFDISQSSPKFMKLTEFIGITSRNMYVKFEAVWRSFNFWQKVANSAGPKKEWNFDIFSKFSEIHKTYRIYWNHLQEHACEIWSSLEKFQFLTEKCRQRRTLEKGWNFDIFSKFSKIHETYRIIGITSRNMKQFGEVSIFDRKMPTVDLRNRMNFWHFLRGLQNS